jgi:hypothetical protein
LMPSLASPSRPQTSIWVGYDSRWVIAHAVCRDTIGIPSHSVVLDDLRKRGLYWREHEIRDGQMWDKISDAAMSTEFAISRFLVPHLAGTGLAAFMDCDMLVRSRIEKLFSRIDHTKAVSVVKHDYAPPEGMKMEGQLQQLYKRKNWSSLMVFNCDHPANQRLTVEMVNTLPGRDLHRFCWLGDDEIGSLPHSWNYLVGHTSPRVDPDIVHFTEGGPWMSGYENVEYADEWREARDRWLSPQ